jgi:O-antigen/teichoic acid export membrane protein
MAEDNRSLVATATVVRNSTATIMSQLVIRALLVVFAAFVARRLGNEEYGRYALVTSTVYLFSFPADLGLSLYSIREIARDHHRASFYSSNSAAIRVLVAFPVATAAALLALVLGYEQVVVMGVVIAAGGFVMTAFQGSLETVLVGYERLDYAAVLHVVGQVVFMGASIWALRQQASFLVIIAASFVGIATTAALSLIVAQRRLDRLRLELSLAAWPGLIRAALPIALLQLFFSIGLRTDTFLLKRWQGDAVVGWYSAAYDIVFGLFIVANGVNMSVFATVSRISKNRTATARALARSAAKYLMLFSLPCAVGGILLADRVVDLLCGPEFAPTAALLRLLLCALPLRFLVGLADNLSIVYERAWQAAGIALGGAALNITLNVLLTPRFGAPAAAAITIISEGLVLGLLLRLLRDQALLRGLSRFSSGLGFALGAMTIAVVLLWNMHVLFIIGASAVSYAAVLVASRIVSVDEIAQVVQVVARSG